MDGVLTPDRFIVGATDPSWFAFLKAHPELAEVNFWRPGAQPSRAPRGTPWFFHERGTPRIVGCGFFSTYSRLPIGLAWEAFGIANGFISFDGFLERIAALKQVPVSQVGEIGCVILSDPCYFEEPVHIDTRMYGPVYSVEAQSRDGQRLWAALTLALSKAPAAFSTLSDRNYTGTPRIIVPRLGQGTFRVLVTEAYERRCAVTGERTLPALEAAHIKPFSIVKEHRLDNGLLLRSDLHKLFDQGYVGVQPDLTFRVSKAIREEFENGRDYYALNGQPVRLPASGDAPSTEYLEWHYSTLFKG